MNDARLNMRLPRELLVAVEAEAQRRYTSPATITRQALALYLGLDTTRTPARGPRETSISGHREEVAGRGA